MFEGVLRAFGVPMVGDRGGGEGAAPTFSRAPRLLPASPGWDLYAQRQKPQSHERQGGLDIFVGGGADDLMPGGGVMRSYSDSYAKQTGRPTRYLPNAQVGHIVDAIREGNSTGGPVNVVGHSWGGPDAYNAAAAAATDGLKIDNLVTLDPVSGPSRAVYGPPHATTWMNVYAAPAEPDYTDLITRLPPFSRKPSNLPVHEADQPVAVTRNHWDVAGMMCDSGARALLDGSRVLRADPSAAFDRPPTGSELHDNLPMMDWIKAREAQKPGPGAVVRRPGNR